MKIALVQFTSEEIKTETKFLSLFSNDMEEYFLKKTYGNDIFEIVIGIICVSTYFEPFFIPKKPKFIKEKSTKKSIYTHQTYDIEKCLSYDIKLDFEIFKKSSEIEVKKYLSEEILKSIDIITTMKSKIKDFDLVNFKKDLEHYFKEKGFL